MLFQIGHQTNVGRKHSEEWTEKIRSKTKGRQVTQEFRERMREVNTGKKMSPETIKKMIEYRTGRILSGETKQKISEAHLKRTGGKIIDKGGYRLILKKDHPFSNNSGYVREHRLIMESSMGRYLKPEEYVHHRDGNRLNNNIDNLQLFKSNSEHRKYHLSIATRGVKLFHKEVLEIRKLYSTGKYFLKDLSKTFNVSIDTIFKIVHYKTFKTI